MQEFLQRPQGPVDVILDTDAYNEIDDQFALAYLLKYTEKLHVKALYAAPFHNENSTGPRDGMERSYDEILKLLTLAGRDDLRDIVYRGSRDYLPDENTPMESDAARDLATRAMAYTADAPLYVVAIGAITNIASALLINPDIRDRIVVVWLGGHAWHWPNTREFNMFQDVAAARIIFGCGVPLVQLPCGGVVDVFRATKPELECWLGGKGPLCEYLMENTIQAAEAYAKGKAWSRVIWDVTAVAWLVDTDSRFVRDRLERAPIPQYDDHYSFDPNRHLMRYVYQVDRDALFTDLFTRLAQ